MRRGIKGAGVTLICFLLTPFYQINVGNLQFFKERESDRVDKRGLISSTTVKLGESCVSKA